MQQPTTRTVHLATRTFNESIGYYSEHAFELRAHTVTVDGDGNPTGVVDVADDLDIIDVVAPTDAYDDSGGQVDAEVDAYFAAYGWQRISDADSLDALIDTPDRGHLWVEAISDDDRERVMRRVHDEALADRGAATDDDRSRYYLATPMLQMTRAWVIFRVDVNYDEYGHIVVTDNSNGGDGFIGPCDGDGDTRPLDDILAMWGWEPDDRDDAVAAEDHQRRQPDMGETIAVRPTIRPR